MIHKTSLHTYQVMVLGKPYSCFSQIYSNSFTRVLFTLSKTVEITIVKKYRFQGLE